MLVETFQPGSKVWIFPVYLLDLVKLCGKKEAMPWILVNQPGLKTVDRLVVDPIGKALAVKRVKKELASVSDGFSLATVLANKSPEFSLVRIELSPGKLPDLLVLVLYQRETPVGKVGYD